MSDQRRLPEDLDARLAGLAQDLPPERDLWPGIAARIETARHAPGPAPVRSRPRQPRRPGHTWLAAATVAMAAILVAVLYRGENYVSPGPGSPETPVTASFGPAYQLNAGYQAARAGLAQDLEARLAVLPPEARATVLESLATIQRAMADINAALGEDPSSLLLQQMLLAAYQDELAVLANIRRVTERPPVRNEI